MQRICVIAIDRAKKDLAHAIEKLKSEFNVSVDSYLIVSTSFKLSNAYKGDESEGYFKEIVLDFDDQNLLKKIIEGLTSNYDKTVVHCIIEAAMTDYRKVIPFIKNAFMQNPTALEIASEKTKMREAFFNYAPEITPRFLVVNAEEEASKQNLSFFSFPVIIKPNGLTASYLVSKCRDYKELKEQLHIAFSQIDELYDREHGVGKKSFVIEEFIEGELYSVDAYVLDDGEIIFLPPVRVITSHDVGLPGFYGHERFLPCELTPEEINSANDCVRKTINAIELRNSTAHIELYNTKNGWKTVEIGPRIGGYRQELYEKVYGIQHFYNDLLVHFGKRPRISLEPKCYAAAINIYPDKEGEIRSISGSEEARGVEGVFRLTQHASVGSTAKFAVNGGKYTVDALISGKSKAQLIKSIKEVRSLITIEVKNG